MANSFDRIQKAMNANVMTAIYTKVNELLGTGNQLFAMEFPARPLNPHDYEYSAEDCYSKITKPYPVQEAEFLLSDELFDCSPIIQGSNGEKLSSVYNTVINNYVPKLESMANFVADQKDLREWLLSKTTTNAHDDNSDLSRIELCKKLYNEYLVKRNEWYKEKDKKYDDCKSGVDGQDLNSYSKWLSAEGLVQEEILNNYFNDAVVKGHYHEVLTLLGYLNVASPAETLETTKQKMRSSLRRSLDGSSDVYPVSFQPSDWFKSLRPNISPKDLTMAKDQLLLEYRNKRKQLSALQNQLLEVSSINISSEEQQKLKIVTETAEAEVAKTESAMMQTYGASACNAFKAVLKVYKAVNDPTALAAAKAAVIDNKADKKNEDVVSLLEGIADTAIADMFEQHKALQVNLAALKKANEARTAYSEAKVKDMALQKKKIEEQIKTLQSDLDFLAPLVSGVLDPDVGKVNESLLTGDSPGEDTDFTDIIITSESTADSSKSSSFATASQSSWHVGGWFFSASGQSSSSSAQSEFSAASADYKLEIGFRVKKVAFDRGGWFNPNIFKLTQNFFRLTDIRVSKGLNKNIVLNSLTTASGVNANTVDSHVTYYNDNDKSRPLRYVLPAFPMGFVVAKDITIKITASTTEKAISKADFESSRASSGGCFCFRASSSSSSKSSNESAYYGSDANSFYMRIPGPQILGWFLQFTPFDAATEYKGIDTKLYSEISEKLNEQKNNSHRGNPSPSLDDY